MHISGDQGDDDLSTDRIKVTSHKINQEVYLLHVVVVPILKSERILLHAINGLLGELAPNDLRYGGYDLPRMFGNPGLPLKLHNVLRVIVPSGFHQLPDGLDHHILDSEKPCLHGILQLHALAESHYLALSRDHLDYIHAVLYLETHNVVEAGTEVLLDDLDVVGFC